MISWWAGACLFGVCAGPAAGNEVKEGSMFDGTALWLGDTWNLRWGELSLARDGTLTLRTSDGVSQARLELGASAFVDAFATENWLTVVGASADELAIGHRDGPRLDVAGRIPRLDRTGSVGFDAHAVRFHPRGDRDQCVLAWEIGIALVDPREGVVWSFVHDDVDQRMRFMTDETVELSGMQRAFSVELVDGSATVRGVHSRLGVDPEFIAEWQRGIGR